MIEQIGDWWCVMDDNGIILQEFQSFEEAEELEIAEFGGDIEEDESKIK